MKHHFFTSQLAKVLFFCLSAVSALARDEEPRKAFTQAQALKLGEEKIADALKGGEAGEDQAARIYAAAKRLETENKLAQRDVEQILELGYWRKVLNDCTDGFCMTAYGINGGGSMYSHAANRNDADLELFLAGFAQKLPLQPGTGDPASLAKVEKMGTFVSELKVMEDLGPETMKIFKEEQAKLISALQNLKAIAAGLPAPQCKAVVAFVEKSASWIEFSESEGTEKN